MPFWRNILYYFPWFLFFKVTLRPIMPRKYLQQRAFSETTQTAPRPMKGQVMAFSLFASLTLSEVVVTDLWVILLFSAVMNKKSTPGTRAPGFICLTPLRGTRVVLVSAPQMVCIVSILVIGSNILNWWTRLIPKLLFLNLCKEKQVTSFEILLFNIPQIYQAGASVLLSRRYVNGSVVAFPGND